LGGWLLVFTEAEYLLKLENHIITELARFKGTTAQQFLDLASRNNDLSKEKQEAFRSYTATLGKWKASTIKDGVIAVNGKVYNDGDIVGVMIGRGARVHLMTLRVGTYTDKITKELKKAIYLSNYTQWQNSDLVILDYIDNIPKELYAERN